MDQGHLVDHKSGEKKAIGDDDAGIQELAEEPAFFGFCDVGLLFEDDLAECCDKGSKDGSSVTEGRCKEFRIHGFLRLMPVKKDGRLAV